MLLLCLIAATSEPAVRVAELPARIDAIEVRGLRLTHRSVVEVEIGYQAGEVLDRERFELGIARLWNTGIFAHVAARIEARGDETVAIYELDERFFLAPVFNFTFLTTRSYWFRAGLKSINTFGRFIDMEAAYERYNVTNGGYGAVRLPRLFRRRLELSARFERLSRPRPEFVTQHTHGTVALGGLLFQDKLWLQGGIDFGYMDFAPPIAGPPLLPRPTWNATLLGAIRLGRIDTDRLRQRGSSLELRPAVGLVLADPQRLYAQVTAELLAFFTVGARWNLAFRVNAGATSRVPAQLRFYIGGLDQVRGFIDNYLRTDLYAVLNAELRVILFDGLANWLAIMAVVFGDAVVARAEEGAAASAGAVGVGLRVLFPKFPRTGLRVDLAQPLAPGTRPQLSLGAFQFF